MMSYSQCRDLGIHNGMAASVLRCIAKFRWRRRSLVLPLIFRYVATIAFASWRSFHLALIHLVQKHISLARYNYLEVQILIGKYLIWRHHESLESSKSRFGSVV